MKMRSVSKLILTIGCLGVVGIGAVTLQGSAAYAGPRPLCGATLLWDCTLPNGTHKLVGGTVCDINAYQKSTGATCVPSGL